MVEKTTTQGICTFLTRCTPFELTGIAMGMLLFLLTGCIQASPVIETTMSTNINFEETPPVPTALTAEAYPSSPPTPVITPTTPVTAANCTPQLLPVTDDAVSWIQWSDEEAILYYNLQDDVDAWWAFDTATGTSMSLPTKPVLTKPMPDSLAKLIPEGAERVSVSPDEASVVYAVELYTEPTPTPSDIGEGEGPSEFLYEVFYAKSGWASPVSLGQVDGLLDKFTWFADASAFLIHNSGRYPGRAYTWLASVEEQTLTPLLTETLTGHAKVFVDLSDDGLSLLYYSEGQTLHLRSLETGADQELLSLPNPRFYAWLLDGGKRILLVDDMEESLAFSPYVYAVDTKTLERLSDITFDPAQVSLSPDEGYLAIVAASSSRKLWVLPVCVQD